MVGFDLELLCPLDRLRWLPRPAAARIIAPFANRPVAVNEQISPLVIKENQESIENQ
jgi:hypothetical protein